MYNNIDGCSGGDQVTDTPAENEPYYGCIPGDVRDTCPQISGNDPINNYMDYANDLCMTGTLVVRCLHICIYNDNDILESLSSHNIYYQIIKIPISYMLIIYRIQFWSRRES